MSFENEHTGIIPRDDREDIGDFTYPPSEKNVEKLHICEAKPGGVACWRHAEVEYHTTAWRDFPSETHWLCKLHDRWLEAGTEVSLIARYAPLARQLQERQVPA